MMDNRSQVMTSIAMDVNLGKQEVSGMPAAVQRSSSLDSMPPPMQQQHQQQQQVLASPEVSSHMHIPIPIPTCTHMSLMTSSYTPAAVQRSRSLPLLDSAQALPPELLQEITEQHGTGVGNDGGSDGMGGMDQNDGRNQGMQLHRDYHVHDGGGMQQQHNSGMGHNGMGNQVPQSPGIGNHGVVPQSPGIQGGVVPQSPGIQGGVVPQSPGIQGGVVPQSPGIQGGVVPQSPGIQGGCVPQSPGIGNQGGVVPQSPGIQSPCIQSPCEPLNLSQQSDGSGGKQMFFPPSGPGVVGRPNFTNRGQIRHAYMPPISEYYQSTRFPFRPTMEQVPVSYGFPQVTTNLAMSNSYIGKIDGYGFLSGENTAQLINVQQGGAFLRPPPHMFITRPLKDHEQLKDIQRPLGIPIDQHDNNNDKTSPNMQAMSDNSHLSDRGLLPLSVNVSTAFVDPSQENSPASLSRQSNSPASRFKVASDQMLSMLSNYNDEQLLQDGGLMTDDNFLMPSGPRIPDNPNSLPGMDSNPASVNNEPFDLFESGTGDVDDGQNYMTDSLSPPQSLSVDTETVHNTLATMASASAGSDSIVNAVRAIVTRDGTSVVVTNQIPVPGKLIIMC